MKKMMARRGLKSEGAEKESPNKRASISLNDLSHFIEHSKQEIVLGNRSQSIL
jgi:hypothetical protein